MAGYQVIFYPEDELESENTDHDPVRKKLRKIGRKHRKKHDRLVEVIKSIQNEETGLARYEEYLKQEIVKPLPHSCSNSKNISLFEFRVPKVSISGVIRVYFCLSKKIKNKLVILDVEYKTITASKTATACERREEYWRIYDKPR